MDPEWSASSDPVGTGSTVAADTIARAGLLEALE